MRHFEFTPFEVRFIQDVYGEERSLNEVRRRWIEAYENGDGGLHRPPPSLPTIGRAVREQAQPRGQDARDARDAQEGAAQPTMEDINQAVLRRAQAEADVRTMVEARKQFNLQQNQLRLQQNQLALNENETLQSFIDRR